MLKALAACSAGAAALLLLAIALNPSAPQPSALEAVRPETRYFVRAARPLIRVPRGQRLYEDVFAEPEPDYSQEIAVMEGIQQGSELNADYYLAKNTDMDHTFPHYEEPDLTWNDRVWCSTPTCDYTGLDSAEFPTQDYPAAKAWQLSWFD